MPFRPIAFYKYHRIFYQISLNSEGQIISEIFQGAGHTSTAFNGEKFGTHPYLINATANCNFSDTGTSDYIFFLSSINTSIAGHTREYLMDLNPWSYKIMGQELINEDKYEQLNKYLLKSEHDLYSEVIVYSEELKIAGTVDLLVFDKISKKYKILDWKTSKAIKTDSYKMKTGNRPETADLLDCKFNHYALQLSLYRYLLEKNYNLELDDQLIVHLDNNSVHGYIAPYLEDHIVSILKNY